MMMRLYFRGNECCVYLWIKLIIDNNNKPIFVPLFKLQYWKDKLSNKVLNQTVADAKVSEYIERMITFPFYGTELFWNLALSVSVPNLILPSKMFLEGQGQVFSYFFFKIWLLQCGISNNEPNFKCQSSRYRAYNSVM